MGYKHFSGARCFMCCTSPVLEPADPPSPVKPVKLQRPFYDTANVEGDELRQRSSSMPFSSTDGPALPPEIVKAFLQSHQTQDESSEQSQLLASAASIDTYDGELETPNNSRPQLPNPFAVSPSSMTQQQMHQHHQQPPVAPDITSRYPMLQQQQQTSTSAAAERKQPKQRSFLRRLMRGLLITGVSTGLVAAGAYAGKTAYKHYMAQLDDRDQLAKRVGELKKQEMRLVLRCTAIEQERDHLKDKVQELSKAVSDANLAKADLKQQLRTLTTDRDEAVRHNLKLQSKLSALEEDYAGLLQVNKEAVKELNESKTQVEKLIKEANQLAAVVEKLESRCAQLEYAAIKLEDEQSEARHRKQHC